MTGSAMVYTGRIPARQRALSGLGALAILAVVGLALGSGFDLPVVRQGQEAITAITLPAPEPPSEVPAPQERPADKPSGKASPANKQAKAAPIAASKPKIPPPVPSPISAAPNPGTGNEAAAGAAPTLGPGSGADGRGDGTGAGGSGNGQGGGTKAAWRSGEIRNRDYPKSASRARVGGEVEVRFTIQPSGRVTACRVTRSSGDASLDTTTCRLIEERFRFRPATDSAGRPVASTYGWRQTWWLEDRR